MVIFAANPITLSGRFVALSRIAVFRAQDDGQIVAGMFRILSSCLHSQLGKFIAADTVFLEHKGIENRPVARTFSERV